MAAASRSRPSLRCAAHPPAPAPPVGCAPLLRTWRPGTIFPSAGIDPFSPLPSRAPPSSRPGPQSHRCPFGVLLDEPTTLTAPSRLGALGGLSAPARTRGGGRVPTPLSAAARSRPEPRPGLPRPLLPRPTSPSRRCPGNHGSRSFRRQQAQRSSGRRHRCRSGRHRSPVPAPAPAPTRSAMPSRRAPAPGAQLLPAPALLLLLLLLGAGPRGCCLATPVPAAPLPAPGPCAAQPCRNGGVCTPRPESGPQSSAPAGEPTYSCTCPAGVSGANCQVSGRGGRRSGRRPGTCSLSWPAAERCSSWGFSKPDTSFSPLEKRMMDSASGSA